MSETKIITLEELEQIKYQDLQAKFEGLGIPEVWRQGAKKAVMIEAAIEKLTIVKSLENLNKTPEEIAEELSTRDSKLEEIQKEETLALAKAEEDNDSKLIDDIKKLKLNRVQIEKNLSNIKAGLQNNIASHRGILLKKKAMLEDLLKNYVEEIVVKVEDEGEDE
jgi:hypothetical protein